MRSSTLVLFVLAASTCGILYGYTQESKSVDKEGLRELVKATGLEAEQIDYTRIAQGFGPPGFERRTGARYKPSYNEDPAIPVQCWIETGYGTQNACKYCHTDYLAEIKHGNAFPIAEDQILYSFPTPNLNRINWFNIIKPEQLIQRLKDEHIDIPDPEARDSLRYVRTDNWRAAYRVGRPNDDDTWNNLANARSDFQLMPALNPNDLYPYHAEDPTDGKRHGYIDAEGFVRNRSNGYTGWRAVNFFPYAIFTPLTGSVSGIYIRLPRAFMTTGGTLDIKVLKKNLVLLEKNIKNRALARSTYLGDAQDVPLKKGFYPVGTEFAHPLHYVDLNADGERGAGLDGLSGSKAVDYEFPGTRSKRIKEIRYLYKWKDVDLADIGEDEASAGHVVGKEWKAWIDNKAGWILAAYIEDREGGLRPQTTEELLQCLGCHSSVGNTVDSVWSFQRKLPGAQGWREMDYGNYRSADTSKTQLSDYLNANVSKGELEYFYHSVVGADLFGIMPKEIKQELLTYATQQDLTKKLALKYKPRVIFDDERLKATSKTARKAVLEERAKIMRHYADARAYLYHDGEAGKDYIKGSIFYPAEDTMKANIASYRRIVLDQSFNLGKNTFGTQADAIPFTFRSDGSVLNGDNKRIPVGKIIDSRPWGPDGVGTTPTGIVKVNAQGQPIDELGKIVDLERSLETVAGHIRSNGTFDMFYNPILREETVVIAPRR